MAELRHEVAELRAENIELRREVGYWKSRHARVVERNSKLQAVGEHPRTSSRKQQPAVSCQLSRNAHRNALSGLTPPGTECQP